MDERQFMRISELLEELGQIQGEHGDIRVAVPVGRTLRPIKKVKALPTSTSDDTIVVIII